MNLTEWILASAVVLLFLRCEVLSHVIGVLRKDHDEACANGDRRLKEMRRDMLSWLEFDAFSQRIRDRFDKLDPPRRRATDVKPCPIAMTGKQVDWVWADEPPTRMKLRKKKAAKR